ncbi:hypothetical protein DR64_4400 [Paraburkholderia xenovorans LB400]|nr:hypothetical protein DR64_4400 [Paraburkholderia xenovorans LB400]
MLCSSNDKMAARLMLYMGVGRLRSHHRRKMARSGGRPGWAWGGEWEAGVPETALRCSSAGRSRAALLARR